MGNKSSSKNSSQSQFSDQMQISNSNSSSHTNFAYPQYQQYAQKQSSSYNAPVQSTFNDDEEINEKESIMKAAQSNQSKYDLEKGLSLEVKSLNKHFQFNSKSEQVVPVMVSVKTLNKTSEEPADKEAAKKEESSLSSRPNIDLVCVIDNSGSMSGEKINNVKSTLKLLLELMGENDRISLIIFNSSAQRILKLLKTNKKNKSEILSVISSISAGGGTDINSGMDIAFRVLKDRKFRNPVSSVFLLSDGQDGSAEQRVNESIQRHLPNECFTIHSFGFGQDHDGPLMNKICSLKDGNFYYVEKINQVDEFFVDALGGLFSVVAQEIVIDIDVNLQNALIEGARVSKTFGEMFSVQQANKRYSIKINQLFSGVSKDFLFEITMPASNVKSLEDHQRNLEIVKANLTALPLNPEYTTKVLKNSNLVLTLFTNEEKVAADSEINDSVEFNYIRVKASEAMDQAIKEAERQNYGASEKILEQMIDTCSKSHPNNLEKLKVIKRDLVECQQNSKPQVYNNTGKFKMMCKMNANTKQVSQAVESCDLYQNSVQSEMVQRVKKSKGIFS